MADRSIRVVLSATVAGYQAQMAKAAEATKQLAAQIDKGQAHIGKLSDAAIKGSVVIAAGLAFAGKAAMDWESDWAGVAKTVEGTVPQLAALEGELRNMAKTMPATHSEIAAVAEAAGQLGVATEDIAGFSKVMIDLGETTNLTSDEAATSLAQFMNVMGTTADEVSNLGATIVDLGNKGASTERDIVQTGQRIAAAGKLIGLSEADVLGFASALASVGVEAEAGGTAISQTFRDMDKAVREGGESLDIIASTAGMSADAFAEAWRDNAGGAATAFIEGLGGISKAGGDANGVLEDLGMTGIRQGDSLLRLAQAGQLLAENLDNGATAWEANSALAAEAEKRYATTAAQVQVAWNNIKDAAIDAGGVLLPLISDIATGAADIASAFGSLPTPIQGAVTQFGLLAVGGLGVAGAIGKVAVSGLEMHTTMKGLSETSPKLASGLGKVGKAAGAVAIALAAITVVKTIESLRDLQLSVGDAEVALTRFADGSGNLDEVFAKLGENDKGIDNVETLGEALERLGDAEGGLDKLRSGFQELVGMGGIKNTRDAVEGLDQALAAMDAGKAAEAFRKIADEAEASGLSTEQLVELFPEYAGALQKAAKAAGDAGTTSEVLSKSLDGQAGSANDAEKAATALAEAIDAEREASNAAAQAALELSGSQMGMEAATDDATASLEENGKTLDITTEKGRANKGALDDVAAAALSVRDSQRDLKVSAEGVDSSMVKNRASFIATATSMGMTKTAAGKLADSYGLIPEDVRTQVALEGATAATAKVDGLRKAINSLTGKTITIKTIYSSTGAPINSVQGVSIARASGGPVWGPGSGTSDSILARLSNGEFVLRAWAVRQIGLARLMYANQHGALPAFANGGPVTFDRSGGGMGGASGMGGFDSGAITAALREGMSGGVILEVEGQQMSAFIRPIASGEVRNFEQTRRRVAR